ncbi:MAG: hypothetical protein J6D54_12140, partial [Olsenella sp.]|nr:hypothetical protein [Olsenella sp.]
MRTTIEMCEGWRFWRSAEAEGEGEAVSVPHDAMLGEGRDANAPSGGAGAYFEGGVYRYEREIVAPEGWCDACVTLEFEGVYRNASVYLNGEKIAFNAYGYSGFYVCLDGALRYGEKNVLAVVADNSKVPNSRWYSGSGIYRPVRLVVRPLRRIDLDGIAVRTVSIDPTGAEAAHVMVDVTHNAGEGAAVLVDIVRDGAQVASAASGLGNTRPSASADERWVSSVEVAIPDARLWSAEAPNLYECRIRLVEGDAAFGGDAVADVTPLDEDCVTFGIRTLEWGPRGLLVNGRETKLAGGCIHHDNGILGAIDLDVASYRKIRIMKEWGYNAVRSAHNPMSKGMLRACDELGMYVMDELCDMWYENKNPFDYAL